MELNVQTERDSENAGRAILSRTHFRASCGDANIMTFLITYIRRRMSDTSLHKRDSYDFLTRSNAK
jgi:hypothetical protein